MEHNLLIYNPISGRTGARDDYLGKVVQGLTDDGNELTVYQTQGKGDAREYLLNRKVSCDKIICCGGDGTLHEVVNGMLNTSNQSVLGYIPSGSTNDYAKNIGINKENAIHCIKKNAVRCIDVGSLNGEYFNYVAAFGAFANIPFTTSQKVKNVFGYFAYLLEGVKHLSDMKPRHIRFRTGDEEIEDDIVIGMVTNAFTVAGIINTHNNRTRLDDGLMEYLFIKMPQNILELQSIIASLVSEKIDDNFMYSGQSDKIVIHSEKMEWTLDGEDGGVHEDAVIETHSRVLNIIMGL